MYANNGSQWTYWVKNASLSRFVLLDDRSGLLSTWTTYAVPPRRADSASFSIDRRDAFPSQNRAETHQLLNAERSSLLRVTSGCGLAPALYVRQSHQNR